MTQSTKRLDRKLASPYFETVTTCIVGWERSIPPRARRRGKARVIQAFIVLDIQTGEERGEWPVLDNITCASSKLMPRCSSQMIAGFLDLNISAILLRLVREDGSHGEPYAPDGARAGCR